MKAKSSVYLNPEQAARPEEAAEATGRPEAELIREGTDLVLLRSHRSVALALGRRSIAAILGLPPVRNCSARHTASELLHRRHLGRIAAYDRATELNERTREFLSTSVAVVSPLVLDEVDHLLVARFGKDRRTADLVLDDLLTSAEEGAVLVPPVDRDDLRVAQKIIEQYRSLRLDLADAVTVVLAERYCPRTPAEWRYRPGGKYWTRGSAIRKSFVHSASRSR
ncbi:type II toxin-antitoxin system VapC family toxin [Nocardia otitidiscaviarum]|nr:hypothetical protein [Nocardia otitidiscaviarum]